MIIDKIRQELKENSDPHTKATGQNFFKETVKLYGVKTALVSRVGKAYDEQIISMGKKEVFVLCEELWKSGYLEENFIACHWSYIIRKKYKSGDFKIFEKWVNQYVSNWASCDTLCNHTIGTFIEIYPQYIENLKEWAKSKNRWNRRAAAVTLILPARKGSFLKDVFEISDVLMPDDDDLVRKGYGWLLKAASESHLEEVFNYVMKNKKQMPRTALRYAIEKMPSEMKAKAMAKDPISKTV